jgi:hypothetical protein
LLKEGLEEGPAETWNTWREEIPELQSDLSGDSGDAAAQDWTGWLLSQPFGPWLLSIVASGLVVYGAFMMVKTRYDRLVVR